MNAVEAIEKARAKSDKKRVRIFLTHDCPLSYANLGPLTFHKHTFIPADKLPESGVEEEREDRRVKGQILSVHPEDLRRALEAASGRVIRVIRDKEGRIRQAWLHNLSDPNFTVEATDLPIVPFLKVEENPKDEDELIGGDLEALVKSAEAPAMRPVDEATKSAMKQARQLNVEVPLSPDIPPTLRKA